MHANVVSYLSGFACEASESASTRGLCGSRGVVRSADQNRKSGLASGGLGPSGPLREMTIAAIAINPGCMTTYVRKKSVLSLGHSTSGLRQQAAPRVKEPEGHFPFAQAHRFAEGPGAVGPSAKRFPVAHYLYRCSHPNGARAQG